MTFRSLRSRLGAGQRWAWLVLLALLVGYSWLFTALAFDLHEGMRTHKADLGQIAQAVWNSSRGRFVEMTDNGFIATRMTDHVEPILALVSPVLWLWRDVRALLLLQVLAVAAGALPLYALARRLLPPPNAARGIGATLLSLALVGAYVLSPQLQSALLTEFHAAPLVVPLVLWAFWAVSTRRWTHFAVAALLVASVKEEMALLAAGLGVWALWRLFWEKGDPSAESNVRGWGPVGLASGVTVAALAWFYIATFVIVPAHAVEVYGVAESGYFQRYGVLGDSPLEMMTSLVRQPGVVWDIASEPARARYLLHLLGAFGFLSLLAPEILLLAAPLLLANLLSAYPAQYYGEFHYTAPLVPYVAVSAVYGLRRVLLVLRTRPLMNLPSDGRVYGYASALLALWVLACAGVLYAQNGRAPGGGRYDPVSVQAHHRLLPQLVAQIPPDAAVTATAAVHPHVALRRYVYQFPTGLDAPQPATWALLDVTTNTDMAPGDLKARVDEMLASDWGVVDGRDGFLLLHRGAAQKEIPDAFYNFARAPVDETAAGESADVPQTLQWLDVRVDDWPRWRQTQVVSTWRAGRENPRPQLELRTPDGERLYDYAVSTPPALLWYPPERWQPGERIRITTLPLYLPRTWGIAVPSVTVSPAALPPSAPQLVEQAEPVQLVAVYTRGNDNRLHPLPLDTFAEPERVASLLTEVWGTEAVVQGNGTFDGLAAGLADTPLQLRVALAPAATGQSGALNLHMQWSGVTRWPESASVFVHLRRSGSNVDQRDGAPRWFVHYDAGAQLAQQPVISDWRQLSMLADGSAELSIGAEDEPWVVAIGLYDPTTGQRVPLVNGNGGNDNGAPPGDELLLGPLPAISPPVSDQACALVPASCDAQPHH